MIDQDVIEKYGLIESALYAGVSFVNNEKIYEWGELSQQTKCYIMGCNAHGEPTEKYYLMFTKNNRRRTIRIAPELLIDADKDLMILALRGLILTVDN